MTRSFRKPPKQQCSGGGTREVYAYESLEPESIARDRARMTPEEFRIAHPNYSQTLALLNDYNC